MPSPPRTASDGYRSTLRPVAESHQWITAEINYVADGHPHVRHPSGWRTRTGAPLHQPIRTGQPQVERPTTVLRIGPPQPATRSPPTTHRLVTASTPLE